MTTTTTFTIPCELDAPPPRFHYGLQFRYCKQQVYISGMEYIPDFDAGREGFTPGWKYTIRDRAKDPQGSPSYWSEADLAEVLEQQG